MNTTITSIMRLKLTLYGAVQGVGFRPFVYNLATDMKLFGWIINNNQGVQIEVEGDEQQLWTFRKRLMDEIPPNTMIHSQDHTYLDPVGYSNFEIRKSIQEGQKDVWILPDIATCPECLNELNDPDNRRYRYPFINCTHCGPRFSIIQTTPYDRPNTSMKHFNMCPDCQREYDDPEDRRFHAQPNACPVCGPHVELLNQQGKPISAQDQAVKGTVDAIKNGAILAIKGLGGFHLMVDAQNENAIQNLRKRKHREEKPFALMFPDMDSIKTVCNVSEIEHRWLLSPQAPILLLQKKEGANRIADSIAPDNPYLGVMLPYTPLHHLILDDLKQPVIATSGNLGNEPICIDNDEALQRLQNIADYFLIHNRPIIRPVDDSIGRIIQGREIVLRRARGFAPMPMITNIDLPETIALGGHLKNTISISKNNQIITSQHIGDLETEPAFKHFKDIGKDLKQLYEIEPNLILHDLHPNYISSQYAMSMTPKKKSVQHHHAHIMACMLENEISAPALGIAWDGTGYGNDKTIWGGEFITIDESGHTRIAHFRHFPLPGGEKAIKEPRRSALGMLHQIKGELINQMKDDLPFQPDEMAILTKICNNQNLSPLTSSAGRIFDAVASLIDLQHINHYEGQAAMQLEYLATTAESSHDIYPFIIHDKKSPWVIDWEPMIIEIINNIVNGTSQKLIARKFHNTMTHIVIQIAKKCNMKKIVMSGGCFQNKLLLELIIQKLCNEGFQPYWHQHIPPNDAGISAGQIASLLFEKQ